MNEKISRVRFGARLKVFHGTSMSSVVEKDNLKRNASETCPFVVV